MTPDSPPLVGEHSFDATYYRHYCGTKPYTRSEEWLALFNRFADRIVSDIHPRRVLDAGCAMGFLVEALRHRGVEAFGVDLSSYAIANVHDSVRAFCRQGSLTEELTGQYDLIVTIEVLEHIPRHDAERAIDNICAHTADVLFSSTPFNYQEATHVNVHPPDYWVEQFGRHGFFRDVDFDASFLTSWAIRFRKRSDPVHRIAKDYERRCWEVAVERDELRAQNLELQEKITSANTPRGGLTRVRRVAGRLWRAVAGRSRAS
jgi:SAM-dependent methyltransferase